MGGTNVTHLGVHSLDLHFKASCCIVIEVTHPFYPRSCRTVRITNPGKRLDGVRQKRQAVTSRVHYY